MTTDNGTRADATGADDTGSTRYAPIEDYGLIGNCRTAALVSRTGSIDWYCPDRFDSPAVFCRILDAAKGGSFSIAPPRNSTSERRYMEDTNVLQTVHSCGDAKVQVTDYMPTQGNESTLVRVVESIAGEMDLHVRFMPGFEYASARAEFRQNEHGLLAGHGGLWLGLTSPGVNLKSGEYGDYEGTLCMRGNDRVVFRLVSGPDPESTTARLREVSQKDDLEETCAFWRQWAQVCTYKGPYRDQVVRSALTLKLLTFEPTGAVVAAPTTSLPEAIGGSRNWDYRFTWLRDSSLILYALITLGYQDEAGDFLGWIKRVVGKHLRQDPQIMYTIEGGKDIPERELGWLEGYRGSRPVRVGNAASKQVQLDIYGEVLISAYLHFHHPGRKKRATAANGVSAHLTEDIWRTLRALVEDAVRLWKEPDNGIWEVRGGPQHFVYSKLMCWAAVDRGIRMAEEHSMPADIKGWKITRDAIRHAIEEKGYNERVGAFVQAFGSDTLDAAVLAIPRIGFLPATDRRVVSTIDCICRDLAKDGLVYRYLSRDGLPGSEGSFLLCTFWLIDALALAGRTDEARTLFESTANRANDLGLFSEEIDATTGAFLGNFPQGFTHLGLIRAAVDLEKIEQHGPEHHAVTEAERSKKAGA